MVNVTVFIDGYNLYYGIKSANLLKYRWLDLCKLSENILKHNQRLTNVKYFTTRIKDNPDKQKKQNIYLEALETRENLDIVYGRYKSKCIICKNCNHKIPSYEEKMTDVNIGVEMMKIGNKKEVDTLILVSGDTDLVYAIRESRKIHKDLKIIVAFPPKRFNNILKLEADGSFIIGKNLLKKSLLPLQLESKSGYQIEANEGWIPT